MGKEVKIIIPNDCELVQIGEGKWEQRKIKRELPKTWEEFCKTHLINSGERYISNRSEIEVPLLGVRMKDTDKNILPNEELAKAVLSLCQLLQLRNYYNGDWKPDWADSGSWKYNIESSSDTIICSMSKTDSRVLAFRTIDLRDQFFKNFKDLIEIAKPLI